MHGRFLLQAGVILVEGITPVTGKPNEPLAGSKAAGYLGALAEVQINLGLGAFMGSPRGEFYSAVGPVFCLSFKFIVRKSSVWGQSGITITAPPLSCAQPLLPRSAGRGLRARAGNCRNELEELIFSQTVHSLHSRADAHTTVHIHEHPSALPQQRSSVPASGAASADLRPSSSLHVYVDGEFSPQP